MDIEGVKAVLQRHGAGFVLDDFETDEATGGHREGFLDRVKFKLSRRADLSDAAREEVFDRARELAQQLPVRLVSSNEVGEAQRRCAAILDDLKKDARWPAFETVMRSWPSVIAHEVDRLVADLEGRPVDPSAPHQPPSPEAVLFQLRDTVETLLKFPALVLARALIEHGTAEDGRRVRGDCFGRLSGGNWFGIASRWAARVGALPALRPLHPLARLFDTHSAVYLMISGFNSIRNSEIGHGGHRLDPVETAKLLRVLVIGDAAATGELKMPATVPLADALQAAVVAPWDGTQLVAGDGANDIVLAGAEPLAAWHCSAAHEPGAHQESELPVRLVLAEGPPLELGPFVRARICDKCDYRDVFLFDTLYDEKSDGSFDLIDYGRGHKMRRRGRRAADLLTALKSADAVVRPPRVEGALSSRDVVEQLDAARVDIRYRSPRYLREPLAAFLRARPRGVYWLQAPAHVGKTSFVQGLQLRELDPNPLIARNDPAAAAVAAFFCKREYREGSATFLNGLERAIEAALDIRLDANAEKPVPGTVLSAADRAAAFVSWLDEWRDFAWRQHSLAERPRLLIAVDGIDETDPPEHPDSLLHLLPRPEQLASGLYLLLTSRRPQDADCPRWLGATLSARVGVGADATTRIIGLDDAGYLNLLRSYAADRLSHIAGGPSFDALFRHILEKAERRFVYVGFVVDRLLHGSLPVDRVDELAVGDGLYRDFLDRLDLEFHPKLADAIRDVLLVLAAEERAHDWMLGEGAQTDRATAAMLKPVPDQWPGLPLEQLARHAALDVGGGAGRYRYDGRFVEILLSLQGVLAISRGEAGVPRYRLGLKGLTEQIAAHPALGRRLMPVHARLATLTLDAIDALASDDATAEDKAAASQEFAQGAAHVVAHIRLSPSEVLAARWEVPRAVAPAFAIIVELDQGGRYREATAWYDLLLWWQEERLRARREVGAGDVDDAAVENDLANAYMNRGNAKHDAPGHGVLAAIADYDAAIAIMERLRETLGEDWPVPWRNDVASAYVNRGVAKWSAPGHGVLAAIADYDAAIAIMERLRETLGEDWPVAWGNGLASAYMNRGNAKQDAPGHGVLAAIADHDTAIAIRERLLEALGQDWPVAWRNDLANTYMNRGNAKQDAPGHGVLAAIADYDTAIAIRERLREALGQDWPVPWRNDLAKAYMNRGSAKHDAPGHGAPAAITDYDAAIAIAERLRETLGEDWPVPWRNDLASAYANRGVAKLSAPGHGAPAAIAEYDAAIAIMERLREALGKDWPVPWRNDLANTYMNRGVAKQNAPGHGVLAAIADYDAAIAIMERLREALSQDWPLPWRNDFADAHMNRGNAKQAAPGHGVLAAIADYDTAIAIMGRLRETLGQDWPVPWRNGLAGAYVNRGNAKQDASGHGVLAAIADYDAAIAIMERLREALGQDWPVPWRNELAGAYVNRGNAKQDASGHGVLAAIADYDTAIAIKERLRETLGEDWPMAWRNDLARAYVNRGVAKWSAPRHGVLAAVADYDAAIAIMERLRETLGEDWPVPWRNGLAGTYVNRGNAKQSAPGHGVLAAIADYDTAIAIRERLRETLGQDWPAPWRNDLANAYMNRGNAKQDAPGHGVLAAIADYDTSIAITERLREALGQDWPVPWRNGLAGAYFIRGSARLRHDDRSGACDDARRAESLCLELAKVAGEGPWSGLLSRAEELRNLACGEDASGQSK